MIFLVLGQLFSRLFVIKLVRASAESFIYWSVLTDRRGLNNNTLFLNFKKFAKFDCNRIYFGNIVYTFWEAADYLKIESQSFIIFRRKSLKGVTKFLLFNF